MKQNRSIVFGNTNLRFQEYLIETFKNYNPDFFIFGHTNNISPETLNRIKSLNKNLITSQWNEDPVMPSLDYSKKNIENIVMYSDIVDHNFITTDPSVIKKQNIKIKNLHFFFVPVDKNIECFDLFNLKKAMDLFYAMIHGVIEPH